MRSVVYCIGVTVLVSINFIFSDLLYAQQSTMVQPQDVDIENGEVLYAKACASCHGVLLEGQKDWRQESESGVFPAPPHDETGHSWHHGDRLLFTYTKFGGEAIFAAKGIEGVKSNMPGFGKTLSDQEIWDILAFIKSTWSERVRKVQASRTEAERLDTR